jgi:hypothetical protein
MSDITKLPKWAQSRIADLERERDAARLSLKGFQDSQTESPFYLDAWYCEPRIKRYVQSPTNRITVEHAGVKMEVYLAPEKDGQRLHGIEITYSPIEQRMGYAMVAVMPRGISTIQLVTKENMR